MNVMSGDICSDIQYSHARRAQGHFHSGYYLEHTDPLSPDPLYHINQNVISRKTVTDERATPLSNFILGQSVFDVIVARSLMTVSFDILGQISDVFG